MLNKIISYETLCTILYHLHNFKKREKTHEGVFLLGRLQAFVQLKKRQTHPWRSVTFSKIAG